MERQRMPRKPQMLLMTETAQWKYSAAAKKKYSHTKSASLDGVNRYSLCLFLCFGMF
jgi:hypothetical protein